MQSGTIRSRRPISAANDIAGAATGDLDRMILEKGITIGADDQLRRGFAGAVRIVSAQVVLLAVAVMPFAVFVAFVRRDENGGARFLVTPERIQQMQRPHDIDVEGLARLAVGLAHQRLGGEVENKIRLALTEACARTPAS